MSFKFNFSVKTEEECLLYAGRNDLQDGKARPTALAVNSSRVTEPLKEAKEHLTPTYQQLILPHGVAHLVSTGNHPSVHVPTDTTFEEVASERHDGEDIFSAGVKQSSDLIPGVYEGGLKVWECTYDLLKLLEIKRETFGGKFVLDLGCGAGLLGILALKKGARQVHFQDFNCTVIEQLTLPNALLSCQAGVMYDNICECKGKTLESRNAVMDHSEQVIEQSYPPPQKMAVGHFCNSQVTRCRFFSGDWNSFLNFMLKLEPMIKYDVILTSETIYNTACYRALHNILANLLAPNGFVYLATKSHYFGVGGGLLMFEKFVEERGVFSMEHLWEADEGLQRHILRLCFKMADNLS